MTSNPAHPLASPSSSGEDPDPLRSNGHDHRQPRRAETFGGFEDRVDSGFKSLRSLARRGRKSTHTSLQEWSAKEPPYHRYVRELVAAGWSSLQDLKDFLDQPAAQHDELVSVIDITAEKKHHYPNLKNNLELKNFMAVNRKPDNVVRVYMAEYNALPSAELIETFGSGLRLDPRFFQWAIHSKGHVFTPSQRHRAPYVSLSCGVLDASTSRATDVEKFKVLVYIQVGTLVLSLGNG